MEIVLMTNELIYIVVLLLGIFLSLFIILKFTNSRRKDLTATEEFSEGQVWSYKARPGEEESIVMINKVDVLPKFGRIFHISIAGVLVKNPRMPGGYQKEINHVPVSEETLKMSLTKLLRSDPPNSKYIEGYNYWKKNFEAEGSGVFTISIEKIVAITQEAINRH